VPRSHLCTARELSGDGPVRGARGIVVKVVPSWLLRSLAHGGDVVTLAAVIAILFACGLVVRRSRLTRAVGGSFPPLSDGAFRALAQVIRQSRA